MRPKRKPEVETFDWKCETQRESSHLVRFLCWWLGLLALSTVTFLVLGGAALPMQNCRDWISGIAMVALICAVGAVIGSAQFP